MLGRVFKAYDIRGTYPDLLTDQMAWQIGFGASQYLIETAAADGDTTPMMRNVVVGRDMRQSSPTLVERLMKGINDQGGHVIDVGLCDTPLIYFAVNYFDCAGGVMTTASHNPPQYNGFKICKRNAKPVGEATGLGEIRKHAAMVDRAGANATERPAHAGSIEQRDLWDAYAKHVLRFLDLNGRSIKLVVDASNGMAGTMIPKIFGKKGNAVEGLSIVELNFDNSKGEFVHEPNPLVAENLRQLQEAVVAEKADFGLCFDGDADRCVVVDETGQIVACDHLTAVLAPWFLAKAKGSTVVYDLRSSKAVEEEIVAAGGKPLKGRVGHVFMKQALAETKGIFGGELSGHFYFRDNFNADSGAIAMATVLTVFAHADKTMSEMVAPVASRYVQSGEMNFENEEKDEAIEAIKDEFGPGSDADGDIEELDGVTIDCFEKHGWWCNVRKSNTEPLLRLNLEARDDETLRNAIEQIAPMLGTRVAH